jgi:hypothetical protein
MSVKKKHFARFMAEVTKQIANEYYGPKDLPPRWSVLAKSTDKWLGLFISGNKAKIKAGSRKNKHIPQIKFADWQRNCTNIARSTAIHEVVHMHLWWKYGYTEHGRRFNKEMLRLAKLGAQNGVW